MECVLKVKFVKGILRGFRRYSFLSVLFLAGFGVYRVGLLSGFGIEGVSSFFGY